MQITANYKATVKGYVRFQVPGGGMVVFSANLFGKGTEPPATIVLDNDAFVAHAGDAEAAEKASKALAKAEAAAAKAAERVSKARAKAEALAPATFPAEPPTAAEALAAIDANNVPESEEAELAEV